MKSEQVFRGFIPAFHPQQSRRNVTENNRQEEQIAVADAFISRTQAIAEAPDFKETISAGAKELGRKQMEVSANAKWNRPYIGARHVGCACHLPDLKADRSFDEAQIWE